MSDVEIVDCRENGQSFSLDGGQEAPPPANATPATAALPPPPRTRLIDRTSAYKCKDEAETREHQRLLQLLGRYGTSANFAVYLQQQSFRLGPTHLRTLSVVDLEEVLVRVRCSVNNKSVSNFWSEAAFGLLKGGEIVCTSTAINQKFKIAGLTEALRQDQTFCDCLAQFELEHGDATAIRVEYRLLYACIGTALRLHAINTFVERRGLNAIASQGSEDGDGDGGDGGGEGDGGGGGGEGDEGSESVAPAETENVLRFE